MLNGLYFVFRFCTSVFLSCAFVAPVFLWLQGEKEGNIKKREPSYVPKTKERLTQDFAGVLRSALSAGHDVLPKV